MNEGGTIWMQSSGMTAKRNRKKKLNEINFTSYVLRPHHTCIPL